MVDDHVPRSIAVFFFFNGYTPYSDALILLIINYIYIYVVGGFNPSEKY